MRPGPMKSSSGGARTVEKVAPLRFGSGLAQVVELVRQGSLFTSSNGDRSLETNT